MPDDPILYSFRRCPYAIRARMALAYGGVRCRLREVDLKHKPQALLDVSPKGTVPVLQGENLLIEESLEIMDYALAQRDPENWRPEGEKEAAEIRRLIRRNDREFAPLLTRYKYHVRYPESSREETLRRIEEQFFWEMEERLAGQGSLAAGRVTQADVAIFPFIRQFALADPGWFGHAPYPALRRWLNAFLEGELFAAVMVKQPVWEEGDVEPFFP